MCAYEGRILSQTSIKTVLVHFKRKKDLRRRILKGPRQLKASKIEDTINSTVIDIKDTNDALGTWAHN